MKTRSVYKLVALLACAVLSLALLAGCANEPESSSVSESGSAPSSSSEPASISEPASSSEPQASSVDLEAILAEIQSSSSPAPEPTPEPTPEPPVQEPISHTVYVTDTGEKHHANGCRYLSKSQIAMAYDAAIAQGYTACSVCGGG